MILRDKFGKELSDTELSVDAFVSETGQATIADAMEHDSLADSEKWQSLFDMQNEQEPEKKRKTA